jgi:hypothetical protein
MVDGAGHMYLNDGIITGNSAGYGGGVALGGNYVIKNYNRVENFTMKGGQITENYASTDGGGMFVQCSMTASIHEGDLTDNTCGRGGNFGGGAIYVNGGRLEKYGYEDGVLNLYDAVITNNTAGMEGGGFAGCMTSSTYTNLTEGAAIYGNTADGEKDDILVSNSNGAGNISNANPAKSISEYMLGGAPYLWKYVGSGDSVGINYLKEPGAINIYTDEIAAGEKASSLAKVHITGNTAGLRGGGIGSNGTVIIGSTLSTLEEVKNITVTKQWVDDSDAAGLRPSTVWVWLLRNGERVSCLEFRDDVIDGGSLTFNNLEVDDENGEPYEYTIEEDMTGMDGVYKSIVSDPTREGIDEEYTITNKLITSGDLSVSKVIEGNGASAHDEFTFKVTLADNTINGTYGDMEFVDGVATFKLHGGESVTAKDLPKNIEYTVEETDSLDYKSTVNGEDADQASGKVVGNNIQDVVFINTKDVPPGDTPTQKSPNNPTPTSVSTEGAPGGITLTGDRLNIGLWLILLIICGAAIVEVLAYGRKKKRVGKK